MNWIDYIMIGLILLSGFFSGYRGILKEFFGIGIILSSIYFSLKWLKHAAAYLSFIENGQLRECVTGILIFGAFLLIGGVILTAFQKLVCKVGLSSTDSFLGILFGIFRGVAICSVVIKLAHMFTELPYTVAWDTSVLLPLLLQLADFVGQWLMECGVIRTFLEQYFPRFIG